MKSQLVKTGCLIASLSLGCADLQPRPTEASKVRTVVLGRTVTRGTPRPAMPGKNVSAIKLNTVGYPSSWRKLIVFNQDPQGAVVKDAAGKVVTEIAQALISARGIDEASRDPVWQVDLSGLSAPGTYTIQAGSVISDPLVISEGSYERALLAGLKSFYFQRTRTALVLPYARWEGREYTRANPSHVHFDVGWDLDDYPLKKRKWAVSGGWHDAGNYDMYVPSTAPAAQTLLLAYEWGSKLFDDRSLNIPESGNRIPDILDEVKWGLEWILSMQEPSGAFRHREAVMEWSPDVPADQDRTVRWIAGVSTAASAKAVAVLAKAARVYGPWDPEFAKRCASSARAGWGFLERTPQRIKPDGKGSEQTLWDDDPGYTETGARFAAAVEMWRNFRLTAALDSASDLMKEQETQPAQFVKGAWTNISRFGMFELAFDEKTPAQLRAQARGRVLSAAEGLLPQVEQKDGYRSVSTPAEYIWGHNSNMLERSHILAAAARLAPERPAFLEAARDQWHWVLGRNPNGFSMVTGVGKGPTRMYHMEWGNREPPPPGFLLGGPNAENMSFLSPGAPAKALLWDNPNELGSGLKAHELWHSAQSDLWEGGFLPRDDWKEGWWAVTESDIQYSANFVLAAVGVH